MVAQGSQSLPHLQLVQGHCSLLIMAQGCTFLVHGLWYVTLTDGPKILYRLFKDRGSDADSVVNPTGPLTVIFSFLSLSFYTSDDSQTSGQ